MSVPDEVMPERERRKLPEDLTPLNIRAWLSNVGFLCGCSEEDELLQALQRILDWHDSPMDRRVAYHDVYPGNVGAFYLVAATIDELGLAEHGGSIRNPWLTPDGARLAAAIRSTTYRAIADANGEAYDGLSYGEFR